ncbi:MAG: hypothetical protein ACQERJ_04555 [Bacillota bacterium]
MEECPFIYRCPLADEILLAQDPEIIREYLQTPGVLTSEQLSSSYMHKYCKSDYEQCARFKIVNNLGFNHLPENLLPHQTERMREILEEHL